MLSHAIQLGNWWRVFFPTALVAFLLIFPLSSAFADASISGFFRENYVRAGVFEVRETAFFNSSEGFGQRGVRVPLRAADRQAHLIRPKYKQLKSQVLVQPTSYRAIPQNEWDVSGRAPAR